MVFDRLYSDHPLLRGLGLWGGCRTEPVPRAAGELLQNPGAGRRILLVPDACLRAAAYGDVQQWSELVARYERDWFAPLLHAVARRRVQELELIALNGYRYRFRRRDVWRFWRRAVCWRDVIGG